MTIRIMVTRRNVLLPVSANVLEIYLFVLCVISGAHGLTRLIIGDSSRQPSWLNISWYLLLLVGGAVAIAGNLWPDSLTGLLLVRAAMWPIAGGATMYAVVLAATGQWVQSFTVLTFGGAVLLHAMKLTRHLSNISDGHHE